MNFSKSLYTRGIQCSKSLWLKKYKPEVLTPPDAFTQAVFETGNVVGELACQFFTINRLELNIFDLERWNDGKR